MPSTTPRTASTNPDRLPGPPASDPPDRFDGSAAPESQLGGWEGDALLSDGGLVHVRPIRADDTERHARFVDGLSFDTTYFRFFSPRPRMTAKEVEYFCNVDYSNRMAFVAVLGDDIIAVARYDRLDADEAEVAFVIADEHQGRGLGTLLLEYLADVARTKGISRFSAEVLPTNRRMLGVFQDAGFDVLQHFFRDGVVHVELSITPTARMEEKVEDRERTSEDRSVARLLRPSSVAVIGASRDAESIGYQLFLNLLAGGFDGPVYPVNPNARHVASVPTCASVLDIAGDVDLAVVAVPAEQVPRVVDECAEKRVKGIVVISAGFAETGPDGVAAEQRLLHAARAGGMRMIGPNCMGIANASVGLNATFAPVLPRPGGIGFLSQSGALGIALLDWTASRGLGISSFVSVGNKADIGGNDLLQFWEDDDATEVILLYLESFGNPRKFSRLARRISRRKPIIAVKSGRTAVGTRAATSHTAAAASNDVAVSALFQQTGVIRVDTLDELFDLAEVLSSQPLPAGNRVAIIGNSGGPGILAADACAGAGLEVADLAPTTRATLREALGPNASVTNPVDMVASATPADYEATLATVLADPGVDAVIVIFTPPLITPADDVAEAIARSAEGADKPVIANFLAARVPPSQLEASPDGARRRIPSFPSPEPAAIALGRCAQYSAWLQRPAGSERTFDDIDLAGARRLVDAVLRAHPSGRWLTSPEATSLISAFGIPTVDQRTATSVDGAVAAAESIGYPVALKGAVDGAVHKTELGLVHLDLTSAEAVRSAYAAMHERLGDGLSGASLQPMVGGGVETILGVVQDPGFGPLVMFGMGGVATELLSDRSFRMLPLTDVDATELVRSLRASPLLFGYRGAPEADVRALEDLVLRVSALAEAVPELAELDLNPVIVRGDGALAVDLKVRLAPPPLAAPSRRLLA